jgi:tetratricopeptide (TPR) repeat protein
MTDSPPADTVANLLGLAYCGSKNFGEAEKYLRIAIDLNRSNPVFQFNLGMCYAQQAELPEAKRSFDAAIKIEPMYVEAYIQRGEVHLCWAMTRMQPWIGGRQ